jgi:hypothetical protein
MTCIIAPEMLQYLSMLLQRASQLFRLPRRYTAVDRQAVEWVCEPQRFWQHILMLFYTETNAMALSTDKWPGVSSDDLLATLLHHQQFTGSTFY